MMPLNNWVSLQSILSEQHFNEGDEIEDDLDDDNIDDIIIEEIERSMKTI